VTDGTLRLLMSDFRWGSTVAPGLWHLPSLKIGDANFSGST
jgi:hypothetical protein